MSTSFLMALATLIVKELSHFRIKMNEKMSPITTVSILALLVGVPFLIGMITVYIYFLYYYVEEIPPSTPAGDIVLPSLPPLPEQFTTEKCGLTKIASLTEFYHVDDEDSFDVFKCTGLIINKDLMVVAPHCIDGTLSQELYAVGSGSEFWSRNKNMHYITGINYTLLQGFTVLEVTPSFPNCVIPDHCNIQVVSVPDKDEYKYRIIGWEAPSAKAFVAIKTDYLEVSKDNPFPVCTNMPGAILTSADDANKIIGLQGPNCGKEQKPATYTPISSVSNPLSQLMKPTCP